MHQNKIFQERVSKFFDFFAVCYYHVSTKNLKLLNGTQHEKHAVFVGTIHFPKIFIHIVLQFIRPFVLHPWTVHPATMVRYTVNCHIYLILAHMSNCTGRYTLFVLNFFSFWCLRLIRISHSNTFLKFSILGSLQDIIHSVTATISQKSGFYHFGGYGLLTWYHQYNLFNSA